MSYREWVKTLIELVRECRENDFTGTLHVDMNDGGISGVRKEETIERQKSYREG